MSNWFNVDKKGLAALMKGRSKAFILYELIQNGWDQNVSEVKVTIEPIPNTPRVRIIVEDDDPEGFALALDTPIPTPSGWTSIENIAVGDMLYDEQGRLQHVISKSPVLHNRSVFEVVMDDGDIIVADSEHQWVVTSANQRAKGSPATTMTTDELAHLQSRRHQGFSTGLQPILAAPQRNMVLDPYVLGYWLGNGIINTGSIAGAVEDLPYIRKFGDRIGCPVSSEAPRTVYLKGLVPLLRAIGVLQRKHIPSDYLRADEDSRLALLRGLADSDGSSANAKHNRRSAFYNTNMNLIEGFEELVRSLGGVCSRRLMSAAGRECGSPNGKPIIQRKDLFGVSFTVPQGNHLMPRKASGEKLATDRQRRRIIRHIRPAGTRSVQCITVSGQSGVFLCGRTMVATHNCDLSHAYTLFASSEKKADAEKRGRFNLGEKLVLALATRAEIITTKGGVRFDHNGRHTLRGCRHEGSEIRAEIPMTRSEMDEILVAAKRLIPPDDIKTTINGEEVPVRDAVAFFRTTLPTLLADQEGVMLKTDRMTLATIFEPLSGEKAMLYEMGIPVVETGDRFHVNVHQKVPLNMNRDNVTPAYLRAMRVAVLNHTAHLIGPQDMAATWVNEAIADKRVSEDAVRTVFKERFGENAVAYDPSDPEANKISTAEGRVVVYGGSLTGEQWENVRRAGALPPAGQVTPSPKPFHPDGTPLHIIPPEKWTDGMKRIAGFVYDTHHELIRSSITVQFADEKDWHPGAVYGMGTFYFNLGKLPRDFFDNGITNDVIDLVIHEFGHNYCGDHLSRAYNDALTKIGAQMTRLALEKPELFR